MTIIFNKGGSFWIESHQITIVPVDLAAGRYAVPIQLDRPGTFLGGSISVIETANDAANAQGNSQIMLQQVGGAILNIGDQITQVDAATLKLATAGGTSVDVNVILFMRKNS